MTEALSWVEAVVDAAGVAPGLEARLPLGVRARQLSVRTLLIGILLALVDHRPGHLIRAHRALLTLEETDRWRLGVLVEWKGGPHALTYRQVEYTVGLVVGVLSNDAPDGAPSAALAAVVDALVEASVPERHKGASTSLAVDWSDLETFARPPANDEVGADPEASWGHRNAGTAKKDLFFGYYLSAATMVGDDGGPPVPELIRRITLTSCGTDPVPALVAVLSRLVASGVALGDVLCDSGYAHRLAERWALPVRRLGAQLVMDLHPHDRGTQGTHQGAICWNGNLYCPASALFELQPLARGVTEQETAAHDAKSAELARYKLGRSSADDEDGFHRVACPAVLAKVRCPSRPASMALGFERPEIAAPPEDRPRCCSQQTLTVPPEVNAKTAQKHDYPSKAHRRSFGRRTGVERAYSTLKDPASTDIGRGWCRLMGLCAITLFVDCAVVVRNARVTGAFEERRRDEARRRAAGLPERTRRRRRRTLDDLVAAATSA